MRKPLIWTAVLSMAMLGACTTTADKEVNTKLAAHAAQVPYPGDLKAENSSNIGVLVEPASKVIRIVNFGQNAINGAEVWVNHSFVSKVDTIPPMGTVRISEDQFYDHDGHSLTENPVQVTTVQLHANNNMWNLLGPINQ